MATTQATIEMPAFRDISGQRWGRLTAMWPVGYFGVKHRIYWLAMCDCGTLITVCGENLKQGGVKSCKCLRAERQRDSNTKHGMFGTPTYRIWATMLRRCDSPSQDSYKYYGGRGISVCERWKRFENFLADMGVRPKGLSIDRKDNDGNYEPGNCKWSTASEQARNKRRKAA